MSRAIHPVQSTPATPRLAADDGVAAVEFGLVLPLLALILLGILDYGYGEGAIGFTH